MGFSNPLWPLPPKTSAKNPSLSYFFFKPSLRPFVCVCMQGFLRNFLQTWEIMKFSIWYIIFHSISSKCLTHQYLLNKTFFPKYQNFSNIHLNHQKSTKNYLLKQTKITWLRSPKRGKNYLNLHFQFILQWLIKDFLNDIFHEI